MHSLSIFGTSSDAGKSTLSFALTYLLHHRGIKVAPFKAQNVSNNSRVCDSGGEIAQAQYFAAESIGLPTSSDMNPVLLKSGKGKSSSLIINGQSRGIKSVLDYYDEIQTLKPVVKEAFLRLRSEFECIVAEGAGSPVELNLMSRDLSNIYIATEFRTKIVLVADIERGGVFASIWGVYNLLPEVLRANVVGVLVNKFRGDMSLFDEGREIIKKEFGIPVLGVIPYRSFNLGFEDSQSLLNYTQDVSQSIITVGVLHFPHISNFTDFEPLVADMQIDLRFIKSLHEAQQCDLLILPGTKRTMNDLEWLRKQGFQTFLKESGKPIAAICGGYQMMFETISDAEGIEADEPASVKGLGFLKGEVCFEREKSVKKGVYSLFGLQIEGYEIHNGMAEPLWVQKEKVYGTFVHGIFDNNDFRKMLFSQINPAYRGFDFQEYKAESIRSFAAHVEENMDMDRLMKALIE